MFPRSDEPAPGLTIIEMLVVLAIIGILASVAMPMMMSARGHARSMTCQSNLNNIGVAIQIYFAANRTLPLDSYEDASGVTPGDEQTNVLWSGSLRLRRGLGLLYPESMKENRIFFEPEANWARIIGPAGWTSPDGTTNWQNPGASVMSSYVYRQNDGERAQLDQDGVNMALVTEYTLMAANRFNHGGKAAHILYADGHSEGFVIGRNPVELMKWDYNSLSAIDPISGVSGWQTDIDPMSGQ